MPTYRCAFVSPEKGQCTKDFNHTDAQHTFDPEAPWTTTLQELRSFYEMKMKAAEKLLHQIN